MTRNLLLPTMLLVLCSACTTTPCAAEAAERAGCSAVAIEYQNSDSRVVLSIGARECRAGAGITSATDALDVLARSAWSARGPKFDAVYATVFRGSEEPEVLRGRSVLLNRDELSARWGARDAELDVGVLPTSGAGMEWLYLFGLVAIAWLVVLVGLVKATRAGHIVPVIFIGRPR